MGVGLGVCGAGDDRALANEGVLVEAEGNNFAVDNREAYLQAVDCYGENGGIHQVPHMMGPITRPPQAERGLG